MSETRFQEAERFVREKVGGEPTDDAIAENVAKVARALADNDGAGIAVYSLKYLDQAESVELWAILEGTPDPVPTSEEAGG